MDDTLLMDNPEWILFSNPKPAQLVGLGATLASLGLSLVLPAVGLNWWGCWLVLLLIGLTGSAIAVAIAPRSAGNVAWAGVTAGLAYLVSVRSQWDSSALFLFGTLSILAFVSALLLLMPVVVRRVAVSLFILFHFGGILCAVGSAPPQSWLSLQLYETLFRPYLQPVHLTNAYHFYSPEPGPASLLWFRIEYEPDADETRYSRWIKIPNITEDGDLVDDLPEGGLRSLPRVEFTRRLSLVEYASQPGNPTGDFALHKEQRVLKGTIVGIPIVPNAPLDMQYREPSPLSKIWLSSYVRHVAQTYKHAYKPDKPVAAVKVYRVIHQIMTPQELANGRRFDDPTSYMVYYQGEYEPSGELKKSCDERDFAPDGNIIEKQRDPFLYFQIPILSETTPQSKVRKVKNYVRLHAGDTAEESIP